MHVLFCRNGVERIDSNEWDDDQIETMSRLCERDP